MEWKHSQEQHPSSTAILHWSHITLRILVDIFYTKDSANFETDFITEQSQSLNKVDCLIKDKWGLSQLFLIPIHF